MYTTLGITNDYLRTYWTWKRVAEKKFLNEARTQSLGACIDKRQETVAEWVLLRPILEV